VSARASARDVELATSLSVWRVARARG
jgi:hypothetical protein